MRYGKTVKTIIYHFRQILETKQTYFLFPFLRVSFSIVLGKLEHCIEIMTLLHQLSVVV